MWDWPTFRVAELVCFGGCRRRGLEGWGVPKQTKSAHRGAEGLLLVVRSDVIRVSLELSIVSDDVCQGLGGLPEMRSLREQVSHAFQSSQFRRGVALPGAQNAGKVDAVRGSDERMQRDLPRRRPLRARSGRFQKSGRPTAQYLQRRDHEGCRIRIPGPAIALRARRCASVNSWISSREGRGCAARHVSRSSRHSFSRAWGSESASRKVTSRVPHPAASVEDPPPDRYGFVPVEKTVTQHEPRIPRSPEHQARCGSGDVGLAEVSGCPTCLLRREREAKWADFVSDAPV